MSYFDTLQSIKTVATYLRVSTDAQVEKFSLPAQAKLTQELADKHGWAVCKVYRDAGYSGSWIEKRPAFSTLLKDAARRRFDAVVVTDFDRLTRPDNLKDLGGIQEIFIEHDIKIVTLSDVIDLSDDDQVGLIDAIIELSYLFAGGNNPIVPFPHCGWDPTPGMLDCSASNLGCP